MTIFWLYAGLLFAAALAFILVPQLRLPRRRVDVNRTHLNVGLYRERPVSYTHLTLPTSDLV